MPWVYNGDPEASSPAVDCHTANVGKDCVDPPVQCNNAMCEINNTVDFYGSIGADWLAAGGVTPKNFATWSGVQRGHSSALGVMTTQWTSACPPGPDTSGIPFAGEYGWNQDHTQETSGCAVLVPST